MLLINWVVVYDELCWLFCKIFKNRGFLYKLNTTKVERDSYVNNMMEEVSNLLKQNKIKHEIKGRSKSIYSIYKKLDKK